VVYTALLVETALTGTLVVLVAEAPPDNDEDATVVAVEAVDDDEEDLTVVAVEAIDDDEEDSTGGATRPSVPYLAIENF
jgi:hypothetical protein